MYFIDDGSARYSTNRLNTYNGIVNTQIFSVGEVVSVDDPQAMGRIKVFIDGTAARGGDNETPNVRDKNNNINPDVLPWAMPMNSMFSSQPKVGEAVFVFNFDNTRPFIDRIYFGPIISQPQNLNNESYNYSPLKGLSISNKEPDKSVFTIPAIREGVFPDPQDVSVQGRYNTDITQKHNEIIIRAGKFQESSPSTESGGNPYSFSFNSKTQAFIQIKNNVRIVSEQQLQKMNVDDVTTGYLGSITNIVASKINLLTHRDGSPTISLNPTDLLSEADMEIILTEAHQLPFGDVLLEYLKLMKNAILYHVHNGNGNPSTDLNGSGNVQAVAAFKSKADDLEKNMLSKNIRIN